MKIGVYISGHGFGHLAQLAPVLQGLQQEEGSSTTRFLIRSPLPENEVRARLRFDFEYKTGPVDTGVVQKSAIEEDRPASVARLRHWIAEMPDQLDRELILMQRFDPDLILSDISPLAFPVAKQLGVPGIGLATLDWHTIYSHWLAPDDPVLTALAEAYGCCDLLLQPPMAMPMPVFPEQRAISLIAGTPRKQPAAHRNDRRRKALVLFGGCGNPAFDLQSLAQMPDWLFLIPDAEPSHAPENVVSVHFDASVRALDLMLDVDLVLCKPGYGVLSECWRTNTPIAWVERPDFPEFPILKAWLDEQLPSAGMSRDAFASGRWRPAMESALQCPRQFPRIDQDGALEAVHVITALLDGNGR